MTDMHDLHLRSIAIDIFPKLPIDRASALAVLDRLRELIEWRGDGVPT